MAQIQSVQDGRRAVGRVRRKQLSSESFLDSVEEITHLLWLESKEQFRDLAHAVNALRHWEDDHGSAEEFCRFLNDEHREIRLAAIQVMAELGGGAGKAVGLSEHFWPYVFQGLKDRAPEIRERMVQSVRWFASPNDPHHREAFDAALALLQDPVAEIRVLAVHSLQWFAAPEEPTAIAAFECALRALADQEASVRCAAVQLLPKFGLERILLAIETVISLTGDENADVRSSSCEILGKLSVDAVSAVLPLVRVIANDDDDRVREAAGMALCQIDPKAKDVDLGPDDELRPKLIQGLLRIGEQARAFRRLLMARWHRETLRQQRTQFEPIPPELADVWNVFSDEEKRLLGQMWFHRLDAGLSKTRLFGFLDMGPESNNCNSLFRSHLSHIRAKLRKLGREAPFKSEAGRVYWISSSAR
jgi:HEAT repeat protein